MKYDSRYIEPNEVIAEVIQSWLDWQEKERASEGLTTNNDTHFTDFPVKPTRGMLRAWVAALKSKD